MYFILSLMSAVFIPIEVSSSFSVAESAVYVSGFSQKPYHRQLNLASIEAEISE